MTRPLGDPTSHAWATAPVVCLECGHDDLCVCDDEAELRCLGCDEPLGDDAYCVGCEEVVLAPVVRVWPRGIAA